MEEKRERKKERKKERERQTWAPLGWGWQSRSSPPLPTPFSASVRQAATKKKRRKEEERKNKKKCFAEFLFKMLIENKLNEQLPVPLSQ